MRGELELLDRGVPDLVSTIDLPPVLAAEVDHLAGRSTAWVDGTRRAPPAVVARAQVDAGDVFGARQSLNEHLERAWTPQAIAAASWTVSRVGGAEIVDVLAKLLEEADPFLVDTGVPLGPATMFRALLCSSRGELEDAVDLLGQAATEGDRRAPVWGARARLELARLLLDTRDADTARRTLTSARTFFLAGGYRHLASVADRLTAPPEPSALAAPRLGHLVPGGPWTVGYGVQPPTHARASKGLTVLRHLVRRPHRPVLALEIERLLAGDIDELSPDPQLDLVLGEGGVTDLDERVRARLFDDRARSRVSKLLRRTIDRLGEAHVLLGRHLEAAVRTGHTCAYEPATDVVWRC